VTFANVTADLVGDVTGNASTASALETARTISLAGDLSGSASFNGASDITISASVVNSGVSLDEISDVVITSPLQFQGLMYDGTNWVNSNIPDVYLVRNNTGSTIPKGTLVGAVSAEPSGRIDVAPFQVTGTENSELRAMGIATSNISSGVNGEVMSFGTLTGLDTRGSTVSALAVGDETWAAGDILFAHPTVDGKLTNVRPQHDLAVAFITVRHASSGQIAIRIIPGNNHLEWMHDVVLTSPTDGQFLRYNSASTVWVNDAINLGTDTVGNYMSDITQGTGVTITHTPGEGSNATIAIGQAVGTSASVTFANINATGDLVVGGDLTVNGTTTTLNTETLEIEDNIIVLNSNVSGSPLTNAGVEVQRGTSDNVSIRWNETSDKWEITEDGSAYLEIGTTADISAAALTSLSDLPDVSTAYQIGATGPAGGIIFITPDTTGNSTGKYFEAAPSASQVQRSWATGGNQSVAVSGADATAIGFGSQNTIDIVAQSGNVSATSAAAYASGYEYGGFSDWFLPSTDELQELHAVEYLDPGTIPGLLGSNYWSSTEYSATQAEYQNLGDGGQAFSAKSNSLYVRPVRAFSSPASGDFLKWNGSYWTNDPINLGTDTTGNSDNITEGTTNLYFTDGRARSALLADNAGTASGIRFIAPNTGTVELISHEATRFVRVTSNAAVGGGKTEIQGSAEILASSSISDPGNLTVAGSVTVGGGVIFEGDTANDYETTLVATDPTADRTITLPNATTTLVGTDTTQTLSNKTLTTPTINGPEITATGGTPRIHGIYLPEPHFITFEGSTTNEFETVLTVVDPTADRTVSLPDASGTVALSGSIALGTDTTGNYMSDLTQGTGVTITHTPGEGSNATIAIGQAVSASSSVTFANVTSTGNVAISGRIDKTTIRESVADASVSASVVTADYATGDIFYVGTAPGSNFTVNLTNAPTDNGKAITVVIFVTQGATGYIPNAVQVAGSAQTIKWANGAAPTPTSSAGKIDIFSFTFVRRSSAWTVFGSSNLGY
jgi:hypothetical protein